MSSPPEPPRSLFASLQAVAASLLVIGRTRLELLANEVEAQKLQALRLLLLALALSFCVGLGVVLLVVLLALAAGEARLFVIGGCALVFLGIAVLLYRSLQRAIETPEPAFEATLAELQEDIRNLKAASGHAKAPD